MGGRLFSVDRIGLEAYEKIKSDVFKIIGCSEMIVPRTFDEKDSFGDLDICLELPMVTEIFLKYQFKLKDDEISINDKVISFPYNKFQIDLCHFLKEDFQSAVNYMAFGDLSNMIGVICNNAFAMRYTHRGLVYPVKLKQEDMLGEVVISKDVEKIFGFIGLDYSKWKEGFHDWFEAFLWITKSPYFNKKFFLFENLNHQNRTRNKKRAMYSRFVQWIEDKDFPNNHEPTANKGEHIWRAALHFMDGQPWTDQIYPLIDNRWRLEESNRRFNGNHIKEMTGLEGKELGECIQDFKNFVQKTFASDYIACILNRYDIKQDFEHWYENRGNTQNI